MTHTIQLIDLGDEGAFLPLPDEVLAHLGVTIGDDLNASTTQDGLTITSPSATRKR
jgi:antitoxin component of MazEF toxin-antitoxin module